MILAQTMTNDVTESSTIFPDRTDLRRIPQISPHQAVRVPTLTIVYHKNLRRVGERVFLSELLVHRTVELSRNTPSFAPDPQCGGSPLGSNQISRRPIVFARTDNGDILLEKSEDRIVLSVDGVRTGNTHIVPYRRLKRGVILVVNKCVALLLHEHENRETTEVGDMGLIGQNHAMLRIREQIRQVASSKVPVLIRGETGTGKELVAQALHHESPRHQRPLVSVNMAAIPPALAPSELFGHTRGAFSGASVKRDGHFRAADGGSLFLDEIGEMPTEVQVALFRVLENDEICPIGASIPEKVDVRIIAATDADLESAMQDGHFRRPLLHRLAGFEIHLPPLRQRRDDIARLLIHFLAHELKQVGESERLDQQGGWLPLDIVIKMLDYDWPGNVRELRNAIRQIAIMNKDRSKADLPRTLADKFADLDESDGSTMDGDIAIDQEDGADAGHAGRSNLSAKPPVIPSHLTENQLRDALSRHNFHVKASAESLGISRSSMYAQMKRVKIRTAGDLSEAEIRQCFNECNGDTRAMSEKLQVSQPALRRRVHELRLL